MVKIRGFIIMLGLSIILFCTGTVYAMKSVDVVNEFETGIVDIELTEYQKNGDKIEPWEDRELILPGEKISKIPRIMNDGNDCYVRAKVVIRDMDDIDYDCLFGMSKDWTKADDGYYYYKPVLPHGKYVDLFEGVEIPKDFPQDNEGKKFYIDIDVDAIQSRNFEPDYKAAAPWGSIEILECEKEGMYDVSTFKKAGSTNFQIVYQGGIEKLMKNHDDFFDNFPYLMPGDSFSDKAEIVNDGGYTIKVWFKAEALEESPLLDKIKLKITKVQDGKKEVIYNGKLRAKELEESMVLGFIPTDEKMDFEFEIEVPKELNNKYTLLDSSVRWIFSIYEIDEIPVTKPVKTGDTANIGFLLVLISVSLGTIAIASLKRKKYAAVAAAKAKKEENEDAVSADNTAEDASDSFIEEGEGTKDEML